MLISIVVIVGAASGVIVLNFILVTWCLFYQRRQGPKVTVPLQKRSSESLLKGKHVKFAVSVKDSRNKSKYASYPASRDRLPSPLASAKVRTRRSDRPRAENLFPLKLSTMPRTMMDYAPSVCSDDTASVYSAASAPLEAHDQLLRSHNSNIIPVTPTSSASEMHSMTIASPRDVDLIFPHSTSPSVMEKGLGPEANNPIQRPRQILSSWRQQQLTSCEPVSCGQAWGPTPNHFLPPGLLVSPLPTAENIGLSSTSMPSPYSPPSKW